MKVAIYCRVSTESQAEHGYSLADQERTLRALCAREGLTVTAVLSDDGVSGTLLDRPAMRQALELARTRAIDLLMLVKLDRLGRNSRVIQELLHRVRETGCRILFAEHRVEDNSSGRLMLNMLGGFAEFELDMIRERTTAGRLAKARSGRIPTLGGAGAPFGYRLISKAEAEAIPEFHGRASELLIIEDEAALVREFYSRAAEGQSQFSIALWSQREGLLTRAGVPWSQSTLRTLLRSETYAGIWHYGKRVKQGGRWLLAPRSSWLPVPVPAIVPRELWERAQTAMDRQGWAGRGRPSGRWLLGGGIVRCGVCRHKRTGEPLTCHGKTNTQKGRDGQPRDYRYYACYSEETLRGAYCGSRSPADALERTTLSMLDEVLQPGHLEALARARVEEEKKRATVTGPGALSIRRELADLDREEKEIVETLLRHGIAAHIQPDRVGEIHTRRSALRLMLAQAEAAAAGVRDPEEVLLSAVRREERLRAGYAEAKGEPERLKALIAALLRVYLHPSEAPRWEVLG